MKTKYSDDFTYVKKCNNINEVINLIVTLDKNLYVYIVKSKNKFYVELTPPFIRTDESIIAKGQASKVLKKLTKLL